MHSDHDLEIVLGSLKQFRLQKNDKEKVRRALLLKMEQMPVSVVREEADDRQIEHMDTLTASFLADCRDLSLTKGEHEEVKLTLQSHMQIKPRMANAPVISFLSVLGTMELENAEKQLMRNELMAAMRPTSQAEQIAPQERREAGFVSLFSSMLGGRMVPSVA